MRKLLVAVVVIAILAIAAAAWWLFASIDALALHAVKEYGPKVTGVSVAVRSVDLRLADGSGTVSGLQLGNPPGFASSHAVKLEAITLAIDAASVRSDVVRVREINLSSPDLQVELGPQGSNLQVIQRNIEAYVKRAAPTAAAKPAEGGSGKSAQRFIIDRVLIRGAKARIINPKADGQPLELSLPDLELKDIGKAKGGATGAEVAQAVMGVLASKTAEAAAKSALQRKLEGMVPESLRGLFK